MKPAFSPEFAAPAAAHESPVQAALTPHISAAQAARGLADRFPYSGGAMATHMTSAGQKNSAHSFGAASGQSPHVVHDPRFVG